MLFCKPNQKNTTSFEGGYPSHVKLRCGFEEWINLKTALELVKLPRISYVEIRKQCEASKSQVSHIDRSLQTDIWMALHRITATHIIRSPVSGKVMEKIGMKKEGVLREHVIKWDKYEDVVSYGILRKEWEACT